MVTKSLSQIEIIRSLGEALAWFQRELSWGVAPASLLHLTGRIGELYAAVMINGEMALAVNQHGYDVVGKDTNERVSVKTITTSYNVTFTGSTLDQVDRIMIFKLSVEGDEVAIQTIIDKPATEMWSLCRKDAKGNLLYTVRSTPAQITPTEQLALTNKVTYENYVIKQYVNSTIIVEEDGAVVTSTIAVLREIAKRIGVSFLNSNDNPRNTRQLGAEVIAALKMRIESQSSTRTGAGL